MYWSRSTATIFRSTVCRRSTPPRASTFQAGWWRAGLANRPNSSSRWLRISAVKSWPNLAYALTTHRCRCFRRAAAKHRRQGFGPICGTTGRSARPTRPRYSTSSCRTGRASIRRSACVTSRAACRPMPTRGSPRSVGVVAWSRQPAERISGATSTTNCWPPAARWRTKRSSACSLCSPSRRSSTASRRRPDLPLASSARRPSWPNCTPG